MYDRKKVDKIMISLPRKEREKIIKDWEEWEGKETNVDKKKIIQEEIESFKKISNQKKNRTKKKKKKKEKENGNNKGRKFKKG